MMNINKVIRYWESQRPHRRPMNLKPNKLGCKTASQLAYQVWSLLDDGKAIGGKLQLRVLELPPQAFGQQR